MGRRLRSKKLRSVLFRDSDGKCRECGRDLPADWHADHIIPYKTTKRTNVHEMQPLCPKCNLKKGAKEVSILRKHQSDVVEASQLISSRRKRFRMLIHVVCGGGKSWLPPLILKELSADTKLAWIVPRLALQDQAVRDTLDTHGIALRDAGNDTDPLRGCRGVAITHQAFSLNPELWKDEFSRHNYVVVIDEPHHAKVSRNGKLNQLASAIQMVEDRCVGLVYMTGTLSTGDGSYIYGVDYAPIGPRGGDVAIESGFDYFVKYGRKEALAENAIVPIQFFHDDGPVKWESLSSGSVTEVDLSTVEKSQEGDAIWTALNTGIAKSLFERGYSHWKTHGNKLLVVCHSQSFAKKYHEVLISRGESSFLAISENEQALCDIREFKGTAKGVLVTCAMAYEGLDEKALSHVICLTHIRSTPWIEQMLARVWRALPGKQKCFAFVPDDPRMNRLLEEIKKEQPDEKVDTTGGGGGGGGGDRDAIPVGSAFDQTRESSLDETVFAAVYNAKQWEVSEYLKTVGIDPGSQHFIGIMEELSTREVPKPNGVLTQKEREVAIGNEIADRCRKLDKADGVPWGTNQKLLWKLTLKSTKNMNADELRSALKHVAKLESRRTSRLEG